MAVLKVPERMIFWEVLVGEAPNITSLIKDIVVSLEITYEVGAPLKLGVSIESQSYVEDIFTMNMPIVVRMGYHRTSLITMFKGKIRALPDGSGSDKLSYAFEAVGTETKMALQSLNRSFSGMTKEAIINQLCGKYNIPVITSISDKTPIEAWYTPIQKNMTDYEMLQECAARWECDVWFQEIKGVFTCFFMDEENASKNGDIYRDRNIKDMPGPYILGYRTNKAENNIAKISWKFKPPKGGGDGKPSFVSSTVAGKKESKRAYTITYNGKRYQIRKKYLNSGKKEWQNFFKYAGAFAKAGTANFETQLNKYYTVVDEDSKTNSYKHSGKYVSMEVELNIGDPWLRPPRTAKLHHGTLDPKAVSSQLPTFLWGNAWDTEFRIYKVIQSLSPSGFITKLEMTKIQ